MTVDTGWEPAIAGDVGRKVKDGAKPRALRGFVASKPAASRPVLLPTTREEVEMLAAAIYARKSTVPGREARHPADRTC